MQLPKPLVHLRSSIAQGIGLCLRAVEPLHLRIRRFVFEVWARSQLRGTVEPGVQFIGWVSVEGTGAVNIGERTRVGRRAFFETYGDATIDIGRQVTINDGVTIVAYANVRIADHTMIGEGTSIRDANHGMRAGRHVHDQPHEAEPVTIGEDAWIGRGVMIGKGVTLGDGAVVGANSVATKPVAAGQIVAGAPARPIGERTG